METVNKFLVLVAQRRIWIAIVSFLSFALPLLHVDFKIDVPLLTDALTGVGLAVSQLGVAVLALWSLFHPNPTAPTKK